MHSSRKCLTGNYYLHCAEYKRGDVCVWDASEDSYKRSATNRNKTSVVSQK